MADAEDLKAGLAASNQMYGEIQSLPNWPPSRAELEQAGARGGVAVCAATGVGVLAAPLCAAGGGIIGGIVYDVGDAVSARGSTDEDALRDIALIRYGREMTIGAFDLGAAALENEYGDLAMGHARECMWHHWHGPTPRQVNDRWNAHLRGLSDAQKQKLVAGGPRGLRGRTQGLTEINREVGAVTAACAAFYETIRTRRLIRLNPTLLRSPPRVQVRALNRKRAEDRSPILRSIYWLSTHLP